MLLPIVGVLTDSGDTPLDGTYDVVFRFYVQETGGSAVWAETFDSSHPSGQVEFDNGLFHVYLGNDAVSPLDVDDFVSNSEMWLGIQVGTDNEMSRVRIASVPWAFEAEVCREVDDLSAAGIQSEIDVSCPSDQYLTALGPSGHTCEAVSIPATVIEVSDIGSSVQAAIDTTTPCNYGVSTINPSTGVVGCATQAVVNDCGPLAGGGSDNNYLGSDGDCHPAPHSCAPDQYLDGDGVCQNAPQYCAVDEYLDGNGTCRNSAWACAANQYLDGSGACRSLAGAAGYIPVYTGTGTMGSSVIYQASTSQVNVNASMTLVGGGSDLTVGDDATITGILNVGDDIHVTDNATVGNDLTVSDVLTAYDSVVSHELWIPVSSGTTANTFETAADIYTGPNCYASDRGRIHILRMVVPLPAPMNQLEQDMLCWCRRKVTDTLEEYEWACVQ